MKQIRPYLFSLLFNLCVLGVVLVISLLYVLVTPDLQKVPAEDLYSGPVLPYYLSFAVAYCFEFIIAFTIFISPFFIYFFFRKRAKDGLMRRTLYNYLVSFLMIPVFIALLLASVSYNKSLRHNNNGQVVQLESASIQELDSDNNGRNDTLQVNFTLKSDKEVYAWGGTTLCVKSQSGKNYCENTYKEADIISPGESKFSKSISLKNIKTDQIPSEGYDSVVITMTGQNTSILEYTYRLQKPINIDNYDH